MSDPTRKETIVRWSLVGVVASILVVYFVVNIFRQPLKPDNFTNSYSTSPAGHSALVELLARSGRDVKPGATGLRPPALDGIDSDTLVLLEPGPGFVSHFETEFMELFTAGRNGDTNVLISMPLRSYELASPQPEGDEAVLWESFYYVDETREVLRSAGFDHWLDVTRRLGTTVKWVEDGTETNFEQPLQVFTARNLPSEFTVLAETEAGDPVVVLYQSNRWNRSGVILVSDPDMFTNRFIAAPGMATLAMKIFERTPRGGTLLINEDLHGFTTDADATYMAATPPGLWVTLSVILVLLIFAWRQATVLRPQEAEPQDRQARKYAIEGLARMMARAGDHHTAWRRILKRSRLVLGTGGAQVQGAGMGTAVIRKGQTGKLPRMPGADSAEQLINVARKVAHQKRTGETEHSDWDETS